MRLEVLCEDRTGLVREVLDRLVEHGIDLQGIELDPGGRIYLHFSEVEFSEFQHLMPEIRRIEGINDVKTVPFTPMEREHNEVQTLMRHLPDAVFSIDIRARVRLANQAALEALHKTRPEELQGELLSNFVKGFSFSRWLEGAEVLPQSLKLSIGPTTFLADLLPVTVHDEAVDSVVGAVVVLKSLARVGRQFNLLRRKDQNAFSAFVARSELMKQLLRDAQRLAMLDAPILLQGETGTGKELLARALHQASLRAGQPFLAVNCAALPDDVAESELFGYHAIAGAASADKRGIVEQANGGTVLLDGIGDMSDTLQAKLLRFLQEGAFRRVGSEEEVRVDVRVIATTQKALLPLIEQGQFREDLYYRINVLSLTLPPLRERIADILPLTEMFVMQFAAELQRDVPQLGRQLCDFLQRYPWPGNVRQLRNSLYRAISLLEGEELQIPHLALPGVSREEPALAEHMFEGTLDTATKRFEKSLLQRLYPAYPSTRLLARRLGVSHTAIANKLREYGIGKKS